jgi:transposase
MTEQQLNELQRAYRMTKNGAERTRYQAVWLYGQGDAVVEICRITGCSTTSLMDWTRQYRAQGLEGLVDHRDGRNRARLTPEQTAELSDKLRLYTPRDLFGADTHTASGQHWTVEDLARAVQQWYGVNWQSRTSYHTLFARCKFTYQRTEKVYKSRRERDVMDWEAMVEKN